MDDIGAEYNTMVNVKLHGGGSGIGYNLSDNANDFKVIGGNIQATDTAIQIEATSTTMAVNGVTFQDVSVEGYKNAALRIPQYAYGIRWFGGRLESSTGTLLDIGSTGVKQIYIYSPDIAGSQGYGVDPNGVVNWIGYTGGPPGPTVSQLTGRIATRVGTALDTGAFTLDGWGTGAFAAVAPGSRDQRGQLTNHTGSTPQKNASIMLPFSDGTWTTPGAGPVSTPPFCLTKIQSVSPSTAKVVPLTETTTDTELDIGVNGAPSANATYTIGWMCLG